MLPKCDGDLYCPEVLLDSDDTFVCAICKHLVRVAAQPSQEDAHMFCVECLSTWVSTNNSCPICRSSCFVDTIVKVAFLDRLVNSLKVRCYAYELGCPWTGEFLALRTQHWPNQCEHHTEPCRRCQASVAVAQQKKHDEEECPDAPIRCELCRRPYTRRTAEDHLATCPEALVPCPNHCGEEPPRKKQKVHLSSECRESVVPCLVTGCTATVKRGQLDQHVAESSTEHLLLLMHANQRLQAEVQCLRSGLATLRQDKDDLQDEVSKLQAQASPMRAMMTICTAEKSFASLCQAYPIGSSFEPPPFSAHGLRWQAEFWPSGHTELSGGYVSFVLRLHYSSMPDDWSTVTYKYTVELFADSVLIKKAQWERELESGEYIMPSKFVSHSRIDPAAMVKVVCTVDLAVVELSAVIDNIPSSDSEPEEEDESE